MMQSPNQTTKSKLKVQIQTFCQRCQTVQGYSKLPKEDIKVSKGTKCSTKSGGKGTNMQRKINMQAT